MIPYSRLKRSDLYTLSYLNCLKTIPFTAAHTYLAHIWQYPRPPAPGLVYTSSVRQALFQQLYLYPLQNYNQPNKYISLSSSEMKKKKKKKQNREQKEFSLGLNPFS